MISGPKAGGAYNPITAIENMRDAAALVRCCVAGDGEAARILANQMPEPRFTAVLLAGMCAALVRRAGWNDDKIRQFLAEVTASANDAVLDRPRCDSERR